eukprot:jgi/Orpsp1_1/1180815/evm.model.c7180000074736.1
MLCSTLVFNESVTQLSTPILNIIKYVNKQKKFITEENFIIMLLMNKVTHFENKRKNITDLLRDNSIPIMLLNNYTKENGHDYLMKTLAGPMEKVLPMKKNENENDNNLNDDDNKQMNMDNNIDGSEEKEVDIDKEEVKKQTDIILKENTQNIQKACTLLLKAITTSKNFMPSGFKSICQSLAYVIQRIYEEDNFFFSPNMLYILDEEIYIGNIDDNSSSVSDFNKADTATNSEDDQSDEEISKKKKEKNKKKGSKKNIFNLSVNTKQTKSSLQNINNDNNSDGTSISSGINLYASKIATSMTFTKVKLKNSYYDSNENIEDLSSDSISVSESDDSSSTLSCSSIRLFIPTFEEASVGNYLAQDEDLISISDTNGESYHADEESSIQSLIIGTLLFLRFFIPAITSPDIYKIVPNKLSMDYRRGLILCSKVLTAMCNDVEFGGKEQYMTCFNSFLHEKKYDLQEFIAWTILPTKND